MVDLRNRLSKEGILFCFQEGEQRFIELEDPVFRIKHKNIIGRELEHCRYRDPVGEGVHFGSPGELDLQLSGDQEHIEILGD